MAMDAESALQGMDATALIGPVRRALADEAAEIIEWRHAPLAYTRRTPVSGGVYRVTGRARTHGTTRDWSLILKIAQSPAGRTWPDGRPVPVGWGAAPTHNQYWRREALAYRSGLLDDLPGDLVAPRCFGVVEETYDTIFLWLEDVRETEQRPWSLARYGLVARHLGQFNGASLTGRPIPAEIWLNRGFLRAWSAETASVARIEQAEVWAHPLVRQAFPGPVAERLLRLSAARDGLLATLERQPQVLCHFDAFPGNLLARRDATGREQTVALDWAFVGYGAIGEEVGQLVACSLFLGEVAMTEAALRAGVLDSYCEGLRAAGWPGSMDELSQTVSANAAVAAALRWVFIAANLAVRAALGENPGRSSAEGITRQARLTAFLLDWIDEPCTLPAMC